MSSDGTGTTAPTIEFNLAQTVSETAGLHVATRDDGRAGQDRASPEDEQHARARRWAKASFGPASLDHDIVRPLRDSIDDAIARGYLGFAATMLEQALYSGTGKHPWALMRLLDIYSALAQPDNHDRVCAEIETLYSVRPPSYLDRRATDHDDASAPCEASLLDTLVDWPALCAAWASDGAAALLETCLLRGKNKFELDISTFADLLFLHELAQTRAGLGNQSLLHAIQGDQTTAPPEPTIDTPPGVSTRSTTAMIDSTESSKGAHGTLV
jgi:hypothetical protein